MPYPVVRPSARSYESGDWPIRKYRAQNGAEVRLLYGNKRTNLKIALSYTNIADTVAAQFLSHFNEVFGTYRTFQFSSDARVALFAGWTGTAGALEPPQGVDWRYESAPQIQAIRPGISSVTVNLIGVI